MSALLFLLFPRWGYGQEEVMTLKNFSKEDGLGLKFHYSAAQDSKGFIWLGTGDGLYRYDGHKFKRFRSPLDEDNKSISSILITVVFDSLMNRLWLASQTDLQYFDLNDYTFHSWSDPSHEGLTKKSFFKRIIKINDHTLWISSGDNIFAYHIPTKKFERINDKFGLPQDCNAKIIKFFKGPDDKILVLFTNYLLVTDPQNFNKEIIKASSTEYFSYAYYMEAYNKIFIAASEALIVYDLGTKEKMRYSKTYPIKNNKSLNYTITLISPFDDHHIMIPGKEENLLFDIEQRVLTTLKNSPVSMPLSLIPSNVFEDREGNVWFNSFDNFSSVFYRNKSNLKSTGFLQNKDGINIEPYKTTKYAQDWYAVAGSGITGILLVNATTCKYDVIDNPVQKTPIVYDCIVTDDGRLYNADEDNINLIQVSTKTFIPLTFKLGDVQSGLAGVRYLRRIDATHILAQTKTKIFVLDMVNFTGKEIRYSHLISDPDMLKSRDFFPIGMKNGIFYFGSGSGIFVLDNERSQIKQIHFPPAHNTGKTVTNISDIDVDQNGNIWIGSPVSGLYKYDPKRNRTTHFNADNSRIVTNLVNRVYCMPGMKTWVASGDVIYIYNDKTGEWMHDISSKTGIPGIAYDIYYSRQDDLIALNYYPYILFYKFNAKSGQLRSNPILFTSVKVGGEEMLKFPIERDTFLNLSHDKSDIEISFSNLSMTYSFNNRYRYMLQGLDSLWTHDDKNVVSYKRLPPGEYTFLVQASNAEGLWHPLQRKIKIVIHPVFYLTWWFQILLYGFLGLLIYLYYRYRVDKIKLSESLKVSYEKQLSKLELRALRAQMNPHFIFNSLNSIQKFIFQKDEYAASQYLTKFSRLIRYILENSHQDFVSIRDEVALLKYYLELEALRFEEKFKFSISIEEGVNESWLIPPMVIQPHVENAIWHGLIHSDKVGKLDLNFQKEGDAQLKITICDNGVGRVKSRELKSKNIYQNKSFGSTLSEQRLLNLNTLYKWNTVLNIYDLYDEDGAAMGTKVELILPVILQDKPEKTKDVL